MRKSLLQFIPRYMMLLLATLAIVPDAVAQSNGKSNTSTSCYSRLDCIPAAGKMTEPKAVLDSLLLGRTNSLHNESLDSLKTKGAGSDQQKSRFTAQHKGKESNPLRTSGKPSVCSPEVTVFSASGAIQAPNTWMLQKDGDVLVVNLSGLPKGKYKISVKTNSGVEEFEVGPQK